MPEQEVEAGFSAKDKESDTFALRATTDSKAVYVQDAVLR